MLDLENKKSIVEDVNKIATSAQSVIASEYRGLTAIEMVELRANARDAGVHLQVVKNTLARRAFVGTGFECMNEEMSGPLVLAFSQEDPGSAARIVSKFAKEHKALVVKLVAIDGQLLEAGDVDRLAKMPTKDEAISLLMAVMKAPVEKLARTLSAVPSKLVRTLAAVKEDKE